MANKNEIAGASAEERGIPGTTVRKKTRVRTFALALVVVLLLLAVIAFSIVTVNRFTARKMQEKAEQHKADAERLANSGAPAGDLSGEIAQIKRDEAARAAADAAAASTAQSTMPTPAGAVANAGPTGMGQLGASQAAANGGGGAVSDAERQRRDLDARRLSGDVSIFAASDAKASGPSNGVQETLAAITATAKAGPSQTAASGKKNAFEDQLTPSTIEPGDASLLPDLDYLLQRGYTIRCGVITRVVSTWPGAVKCTVLQDVYSANGHTLLIRAGAQAFGESRTALMQGQAKIPVLWNEIDDGKVKITLNSPAADALGGSGMDAYVDNHFWLRFGGAMMVSLISDFGQALANKTVGGGTSTVTFSGTSNTADSAAEQALKSTIDIPPTAYTNQGAVTNIFVARHIDMSNVYKVIHSDDR
jgi:type IV secretion system protein VirB10